jgi:hypothetical protein
MFEIDFVRPGAADNVATLAWTRMGPHATLWADAALRATDIDEFRRWFRGKIEAVAFDDGVVVFLERPRNGVSIAHPFVSPSLRDREAVLRDFLREAGGALCGLIVELHLCSDVAASLREVVEKVGFQKVGAKDTPLRREATSRRAASSTMVEKWRILL